MFWGMVALLVAGLLLFLMWRSWQKLRARSKDFNPWPCEAVITHSFAVAPQGARVVHLATTHASRPLDRICVGSLGHRAAGFFYDLAEGVLFDSKGQKTYIPFHALRLVRLSSWAIDRAAPLNRILVVSWQLPDSQVVADSYFMVANKKVRLKLLERLVGAILPERSE